MDYGLNQPVEMYPEKAFVTCRKCGYRYNTVRHPYSSAYPGDGVSSTPNTQLYGAVSAGDVTITVVSTAAFATPMTGSITAFESAGTNRTRVTSAAHGLTGGKVVISSTTNYNGTFNIDNALTDSFEITLPYVADDATGTWIRPETFYVRDAGTYATAGDVSSTFTNATNAPRFNKVTYTGKTSTTFTGCTGSVAHDDDMEVYGEPKSTGGCPLCGTMN